MGCEGKCGGKCSDCKKIKSSTIKDKYCDPSFTGDLKYDGTVFTCDTDNTLNLADGDNLNDILYTHASKLCSYGASIATLETEITSALSGNNTNYSVYSDLDLNVTAGSTGDTNALTIVTAGNYLINFGAFANILAGGTMTVNLRKTSGTATDYLSGRQCVVSNTESPGQTDEYSVSNTLIIAVAANDTFVLRFTAAGGNVVGLGYSITAVKVG